MGAFPMRLLRVMAADSALTVTLLAAVFLLAIGGVILSDYVATTLLRADAEATGRAWANNLVLHVDDVQDTLAGQPPSERTVTLLRQARQIGDVYRFKLWDRNGNLVFLSDTMGPPAVPDTLAMHEGESVAAQLLSGTTFIEAHRGAPPDPRYFAEAYVPILREGVLLGTCEVYVDQTAKAAVYSRTFLIAEGVIAFLVLLAGGLPVGIARRKMRAQQQSEAHAAFLTMHDRLTGIATRERLAEAGIAALALARRTGRYIAVLLVDLDRFKEINDSFGHNTGDLLLRAVALRLQSSIREEDMAARLGGDEFAVLQVGMAQPAGARDLACRLSEVLSAPYDIDGQRVLCSASIGAAIGPSDGVDWDALLGHADTALYTAKAAGPRMICFFEPGMESALHERRRIEAGLRRALDEGSFELHYQPLYDFRAGALVGFEALLRWPSTWPNESPAHFIPIAEETGLIVPIGAWVLETACRTAAAWPGSLKIAVNLSPVQFRSGDIVGAVAHALDASGLPPGRLELEVTESLLLHDTDIVLHKLRALRGLGAAIALDDFGTGYSSLAYLWRFPFDKVKVDRSFVLGMQAEDKARAIVDTIVGLGRTLNLIVTAEGVETDEQADALKKIGCDQGQGYLLGRPLPEQAASDLVRAQVPSADADVRAVAVHSM